MPPVLKVINGGLARSREEDPSNEPVPTEDIYIEDPWWWKAIIVFLLRYGIYIPLLWLPRWMLLTARNRSINRAMWSIVKAIDLDLAATPKPLLARTFFTTCLNTMSLELLRKCEHAVFTTRIRIFGLPVILDWEIEGQGQMPIARHMMWRLGHRSNPLPDQR